MDNALLALYGWFSLVLYVIFAVAPRSSSAVYVTPPYVQRQPQPLLL